jgi:hypothetical protein
MFLNNVYKYYANQFWPLVSFQRLGISLMNIAYPDECSIYHCASFSSENSFKIFGEYPTSCLFWNLTFYDTSGSVFLSVEESDFPNHSYEFYIKDHSVHVQNLEITIPDKYYCIIQRIYSNSIDFIFPKYVPHISDNTVKNLIHYISNNQRLKQSNLFEKRFRKVYKLLHGKETIIQNSYQFCKPPLEKLAKAFPNPRAIYFVMKPDSIDSIITLQGIRPPILDRTKMIQYISIMTSNYETLSTDHSITINNLPEKYNILIAKKNSLSIHNSKKKKNERQTFLIWNDDNKKPIIVLRFLLSSFFFENLHSYRNNLFPYVPNIFLN